MGIVKKGFEKMEGILADFDVFVIPQEKNYLSLSG